MKNNFIFLYELKCGICLGWLGFVFGIPSVALIFSVMPVLATVSSVCIQFHLLRDLLCHFSLSVFTI